MTYQEFKDYIYSEVAARYESRATVHLSTFTKNNGVILDGLVICDKNARISPTLYLNDFYDLLAEGKTKEAILKRIIRQYEQAKDIPDFDPDIFTDFSVIKDQIIFRLVNQNSNALLLEDVPFLPYLDLAIVFSIMLKIRDDNYGTVLIHNSLLEEWGIAISELFDIAKENTYQALAPDCIPLEELLGDMLPQAERDLFGDLTPAFPMYVLSNTRRFHGAGVICYPEYLKNLSEELGQDLYIIPSSIHEVLVVPMDAELNLEILSDMVQQVNATQVAPEEVLANHAYYYLRAKNQLAY